MLTLILGGIRVGTVLRDSAEDVGLARDLGLVGRNSVEAKALPQKGSSFSPDDLTSPEVLAQVREHLTQRWLSEQVPALGGLTPVEAANDPTRRQDLIRLLESFRTPSMPPMGMPKAAALALGPDPDDLAARLGLRLR
jgi:hypothetical protein